MKSNQTRVFDESGAQYRFNSKAFRSRIDSFAREKGVSKGQIADELAAGLCVTADAVNNWKYGKNGPADLDAVKKAAAILHTDWLLLVQERDGGAEMEQLTDRQKDAAKRIYDVLIWFLEEFSNSDGFNSWWLGFKEKGSADPEDETYERITQMEERVWLVMNQEYFDLHDHEIYDALCEFASEDLVKVYDGKVSYAYRFEAPADHVPTAWDDYEKAMKRLNEIIERYI